MNQPELVIDCKCIIGEGPCYDKECNTLYWTDLLGNDIYACSLNGSQIKRIHLNQNVGSIAVRENGGLVAALQYGFHFVNCADESIEKICDPEEDIPNNRFNDGKCDCMGRFWAGTMSKDLDTGYGDYTPKGALYYLEPNLTWRKMLSSVTLSNGLGWSRDNKKMYYIDTPTMVVREFDYDCATGDISGGRECVRVPDSLGIPDGMCIDNDDNLWIALWGGHSVSKWNPVTGELLDRIEIPALNVSCCCFGGIDSDELFVTTASINTDVEQYPFAGGIFKIRPNVKGQESYKFKG